MSAYRFPLETLLELRDRRRQEKAKLLAEARARLADAESARASLEQVRAAGHEGLTRAHRDGGSIGHYRTLGMVMARLESDILAAETTCREAAERAEASFREFGAAVADHQSVGKLRERHHESWRIEQGRLEQKLNDESALTRHARGGGLTSDGAIP